MATEIEAVYRNGALELKSNLPLREGQVVHVVVLTEEERTAKMHSAADNWLAQQPASAEPTPPTYPQEEWARLDAEFDEILAEIDRRGDQPSESEVVADSETAIVAARAQRTSQQPK